MAAVVFGIAGLGIFGPPLGRSKSIGVFGLSFGLQVRGPDNFKIKCHDIPMLSTAEGWICRGKQTISWG